ncbi:MAG: chorismate synthase [Nitrososphaeria archaeon]|jgi:chorismate synthase
MNANTIGVAFKVTCFGESHGRCVGTVVDGCPAGLEISEDTVQRELERRRTGQSIYASQRREEDRVEVVSGTFNGFTTGAPICMIVWNKDIESSAYEKIEFTPRPGHADFTAFTKFGGFNDYRGGGRFSGRITAGFVMAGVVAKKLLALLNIEILAYTLEIAGIKAEPKTIKEIISNVEKNSVRCPDLTAAEKMIKSIQAARDEGDSVGGVIESVSLNVPVGLGEPIFDTLEGDLAKALFAIPAVKGVEFGSGFKLSSMKGSESNDVFTVKGGKVITKSNSSGGILGGISNGMPILLRVAVKPTPSIQKSQDTVDLKKMEPVKLKVEGRHDSCIVPRAVPVVESMIAIVLADHTIRAGLLPRVLRGGGFDK